MAYPFIRRPLQLLAISLLPLTSIAQSANGAVSGQVFCSDTQKPARFAFVSLVPDNTATDAGQYHRSFGGSTSTTTADGTFSIKDVPAGVYNVQVLMPGYIQPLRAINMLSASDTATEQKLKAMLTRVTVQPGQTATTLVTAYRGADLVGEVAYDDGTPASGITISAMAAPADTGSNTAASSITLRNSGSMTQTDDRGRFHLSGLADGTYTVQAMPRGGSFFPVYFGNTLDRAHATFVSVHAGEEKTGLDLIIDITNLHHVRGVLLSPDNHALANATIHLTLSGGASSLSATTGPDGSFVFSEVPDGKFTVSSSGAYDPDSRIAYKNVTTDVTISGSDASDINLTASP